MAIAQTVRRDQSGEGAGKPPLLLWDLMVVWLMPALQDWWCCLIQAPKYISSAFSLCEGLQDLLPGTTFGCDLQWPLQPAASICSGCAGCMLNRVLWSSPLQARNCSQGFFHLPPRENPAPFCQHRWPSGHQGFPRKILPMLLLFFALKRNHFLKWIQKSCPLSVEGSGQCE